MNTCRRAITAAKEAAEAARGRSAEVTFVNDLTEDVVEVGNAIYICWHISYH